MPIENIWEPRGLHMHYRGETTAEEILEHVLALSGDQRFDQLTYIIGDFSNSTFISAQEHDVTKLAAFNKALAMTNPNIMNPTILPKDDSGRSLVALYVSITEDMPWKTSLVDSEKEAREWITSNRA